MRKPRTGHLVLFFIVGLSATGCRGREAAPFPAWATAPAPYSPQTNSGNAFDGYALAALNVEATAGKHLSRVSFYPDQKKAAIAAAEPAIAQIAAASKLPCEFRFVARSPFTPGPYQQGWRLIGRTLRWKIEDAAQAGDFDRAITHAILATRFGFDLTGGGATDASLGYVIADDARRAISPWLPKLGAAQLDRLSKGIAEALARKPALAKALENEGENMRLAVQALQDAFQKDDFRSISENLGPDSREAIGFLRGLKQKDEKRVAYFQGFADEMEGEVEYLIGSASKPTADRAKEPEFDEDAYRPWKRFSHHFFMTGRPLLTMDDRTVARTRLMVLNADLVKMGKVVRSFPRDLRSFPPEIKTDPYSGKPFLYRQDGAQFEIYSIGENLRDDAGDTDETFTAPDLKLEGR